MISIIMKATGIDDDDADIKERIMESMPDEKTFHSLSPEKKCKLFRFVFGHSYFHGLFDDFLDKVCPQDPPFTGCPDGSPADGTVNNKGECCETTEQCYSKSAFVFSVSYFYCIICFLVNSK